MEASSDIAETSSSVSRKMQKGSGIEQAADKISSLPDSVLIHILSFLPVRDAVRTLLIPSFGHLWASTYSLVFDGCSYHDCQNFDYDVGSVAKFVNLVHHVALLHERPTISKFRLKFEFCLENQWNGVEALDPAKREMMITERRLADEISASIESAVRKNVKVLDLDFLACGTIPVAEHNYELPSLVLGSGSIMELKLVCCGVNPQAHIQMKALKTLFLQDIFLSDNVILKIFTGCPLLETLSLIECYGLCKLNCTSSNLESLTIDVDIVEESRLEISCPYIKTLNINGWIERLDLGNFSSLVYASIDFTSNFSCTAGEYREIRMILEKLHHARFIALGDTLVLVLTIWELMSRPCPSSKWQCLVLELTKWHLPGFANLLRNSPFLEKLDIYIEPGISPFYTADEPWLQFYDFDVDNYWNSQELSFDCLTNHLKTVTIYGHIMESCVVQLVQFLFKNAMVLEKIVVLTKQNDHANHQNRFTSEELLDFSEKLLSFPRVSACAVIVFSCNTLECLNDSGNFYLQKVAS